MEEQLTSTEFLTPEEIFYSKKLYFSYSALKKLLWSPKAYYNYYVLGEREDKIGKELLEGKVIHCLLLNNGEFDKLFVVSPTNLPTGNNKIVVDRVFYHHSELLNYENGGDASTIVLRNSYNFNDYSNAILDVLSDLNLHQSLTDDKVTNKEPNPKTANQKRIEKILTDENINYFEYLKNKGNRDVIDQETYNYCKTQAELLRQDEFISKIMGMDRDFDEEIQVINETEFRCETVGKAFGLKGIIDNLVINHTKRVIYINDIKTTSKPITDFKDSVDFYQYWLQAIIYCVLVSNNYEGLFTQADPYKLEFRFIVIDNNQQFYPFKVTDKTLNTWFDSLNEVIKKADYHYTNKKYNLPYELCNGLVEL